MKGVLFLCVANSARSQMAEGIARSLMPLGVPVWSAGSNPTHVRPEAIAVMNEIGIDISAHTSKALSDVPMDAIDTIITLCAEEVCPRVPESVRHLHWSLPDPAGVDGSPEDRMAAFRKTRDELRRRIEVFLADDRAIRRSLPGSVPVVDRLRNDDILGGWINEAGVVT